MPAGFDFSRVRLKAFCAALFFLGAMLPLNAQSTFKLLHSFTATSTSSPYTNSDGTFPRADLIQSGGTLYGTASQGGSYGRGTIFSINTNGTSFTNLHSFNGSDGRVVYGGLVLSGNTLYGTTLYGGSSNSGTIFSINTNGTGFIVLYNFSSHIYSSDLNTYTNSDGYFLQAGLVVSGKTLYGTANHGGFFGNGTVFALNTDGTGFTNLHNFTSLDVITQTKNSDGVNPVGRLLLSGNTLYGTASGGGSSGSSSGGGTVFSLSTNGTDFTVLHAFTNSDGTSPQAGLILAGNTLYGMATYGGNPGFYVYGTIFCLNTNGMGFTVLHTFSTNDGVLPLADLIISGNTLYGTTQNGTAPNGGSVFDGNVFSLNTDGTGFANLYGFTALSNSTNSDGAVPKAGVILLGNTLYGVAAQGGVAGNGTVFALTLVPSVGIAPAGNRVVISWPLWASNYGLQTSTNLFSGSWSNITSGITTGNAGYVFTNIVQGKAVFFRLTGQ